MTTTPTIGKDDDYCITGKGPPKRDTRLLRRLKQHASEPGIYPMTLVVADDGRWRLVVEAGKVEELG